jgi:hypothetical protein
MPLADFLDEGAEDGHPPANATYRWDVFSYEPPAEHRSYAPYLGLCVAPTWGDLARWTNRVRAATTDDEQGAIARDWADEVNGRHDPQREVEVTARELIAFTDTVVNLLERKFNGEPIANEANQLIAPMRGLVIKDHERDVLLSENSDVFWAFEYYFLFSQLRSRDSVWWKAVGKCDNEKCGKFFIRQRADNRFDSDKCRQNAANRKFYQRRARSHGDSK